MNWIQKAFELREIFSALQIDEAVLSHLSEKSGDEPWAVACSGGADSLFLTLLLWQRFPALRHALHIFHFNHKLRGKDSDRDEAFVESLAAELGCPFFSASGKGCLKANEAQLRDERFCFFYKKMSENRGRYLCLGHHKNDVAETVLMRLLRGSGLSGLAAPRAVKKVQNSIHLRPLIHARKEAIIGALKDIQVPWCEDISNTNEHYFRNKIRKKVLPVLQETSNRSVLDAIVRSKSLLEEDENALQIWCENLLKNVDLCAGLPLKILENQPVAIWRRVLHRFLMANHLNNVFQSNGFNTMLSKLMSGKDFKMGLGKGLSLTLESSFLSRRVEHVKMEPWDFIRFYFGPEMTLFLPDGRSISVDQVTVSDTLKSRIFRGDFSSKNAVYLQTEPTWGVVRLWQPGDKYRPLGASGNRKLQNMFTDLKIESSRRHTLPVIELEHSGIVWCPGLPPAEKFKIRDTTRYALWLTYKE